MTRPRVPKDKRQRIALACDSCKRRKQKCDGRYPCVTCTKRSLICGYTKASDTKHCILDSRMTINKRPQMQKFLESNTQTLLTKPRPKESPRPKLILTKRPDTRLVPTNSQTPNAAPFSSTGFPYPATSTLDLHIVTPFTTADVSEATLVPCTHTTSSIRAIDHLFTSYTIFPTSTTSGLPSETSHLEPDKSNLSAHNLFLSKTDPQLPTNTSYIFSTADATLSISSSAFTLPQDFLTSTNPLLPLAADASISSTSIPFLSCDHPLRRTELDWGMLPHDDGSSTLTSASSPSFSQTDVDLSQSSCGDLSSLTCASRSSTSRSPEPLGGAPIATANRELGIDDFEDSLHNGGCSHPSVLDDTGLQTTGFVPPVPASRSVV